MEPVSNRRPDLKRKLVVVGDGTFCARNSSRVELLADLFFLPPFYTRRMWQDLSTHSLCRKQIPGSVYMNIVS